MKKIFTLAALSLTASIFVAPAHATTINFSDFATSNEGGVKNGSEVIVNGVNIYHLAGYELQTGRGFMSIRSGGRGTDPFSSYYDDVSNGLPGGLGVCRALTGAAGTTGPGAECLDPSDDSIDGNDGMDEAIFMSFVDDVFDIRTLSFRDGNHNDISHSDGLVEWGMATQNGVFGGITTFADLVAMAIAGEFVGTRSFALGYVDTEFYLSNISDVPIPGAISLLLSGLAGFGFVSRKKKAV